MSLSSTVTADELLTLVGSPSVAVRRDVAGHPNATFEILQIMAKDRSPRVRELVACAQFPRTDELTRELVLDRDSRVWIAAVANAKRGPDTVRAILEDARPEVRQHLARAAADEPPAIERALACCADRVVRAEVASHTRRRPILDLLLRDDAASVRYAAAFNSMTSEADLRLLTTDREDKVREGVAWVEHLPPDLVAHLASDRSERVRLAILETHDDADHSLAQRLVDDPGATVRAEARQRLGMPAGTGGHHLIELEEMPPPHPRFAAHFTDPVYDVGNPRSFESPPFGGDEGFDELRDWSQRGAELSETATLADLMGNCPDAEDVVDDPWEDNTAIAQGFLLIRFTGQIDADGRAVLRAALQRRALRSPRTGSYAALLKDLDSFSARQ